MNERTFVILKPGAVARGLIGEIITRIEKRGLNISALKFLQMTRKQAEMLYEKHSEKSFFEELVQYMTSGPVVVMVVEGPESVKMLREMSGATNPAEAKVGTIRGDLGLSIMENVIHAADSRGNAEKEIRVFFKPSEIFPRG